MTSYHGEYENTGALLPFAKHNMYTILLRHTTRALSWNERLIPAHGAANVYVHHILSASFRTQCVCLVRRVAFVGQTRPSYVMRFKVERMTLDCR